MLRKANLVLLVVTVLLPSHVKSEEIYNTEETHVDYIEDKILSKILDESYNKNVIPRQRNGSGPVMVTLNVFVRSLDHIDDYKMELGMQLHIRQTWHDPRLEYSFSDYGNASVPFLTLTDPFRVWVPDLVMAVEKQSNIHNVLRSNHYIRIYPNGTLVYSVRVSIVLKCPMSLKWYPFDNPSCPLVFSSYAFTVKDIMYRWRDIVPIEISSTDSRLAQFAYVNYNIGVNSLWPKAYIGSFSSLLLTLHFKREISYHISQIYMPCCMLVFVSWTGFWLDESATDARISLAITSLLAMVTQIYGINQSTPPVSYIKALDLFTGACETMIFCALLEFSIANHAYIVQLKQELKLKNERTNRINDASKSKGINTSHLPIQAIMFAKGTSRAKRIDMIARILFPTVFVAFNIVYWSVCLTSKE